MTEISHKFENILLVKFGYTSQMLPWDWYITYTFTMNKSTICIGKYRTSSGIDVPPKKLDVSGILRPKPTNQPRLGGTNQLIEAPGN